MILNNETPFSALAFTAIDKEDRARHVVVLRGTFDMVAGAPLRLAARQTPLLFSDESYEVPNLSSVKYESDLAPYKPRTDVVLLATAHAPSGHPCSRWTAAVDLGAHRKELVVTGRRYWERQPSGDFVLSEPVPTTLVPITYERAFGGTITVPEAPGHPTLNACYQRNPIGVGYCPPTLREWAQTQERLPAPQIESPVAPISVFGEDYDPEGFGVIGRPWLPRRAYAGTYDQAWVKTRWPALPADFDFAYWNCAHPDLTLPRLRGDEHVRLTGLTVDGDMRLWLPGLTLVVEVQQPTGARTAACAELDTVIFEPERRVAVLVWRALFSEMVPTGSLRVVMRSGVDGQHVGEHGHRRYRWGC